jgi:hypothetical protein
MYLLILKIVRNNMTIVVTCAVFFYYLAFIITANAMIPICYISEKYLFAVALNVGFLKRFAGL